MGLSLGKICRRTSRYLANAGDLLLGEAELGELMSEVVSGRNLVTRLNSRSSRNGSRISVAVATVRGADVIVAGLVSGLYIHSTWPRSIA